MKVLDAIRRSAVAVRADQTVNEAATVMERAGVGALAVLDDDRLVGIITDRDLVRRALATRLPSDARVDAVMTTPVLTVDAAEDMHHAFGLFRSNAVRRLAVTRDGSFVGMLTVDDLLIDLAGDLADLIRPLTAEAVFGHRDSAVPATI